MLITCPLNQVFLSKKVFYSTGIAKSVEFISTYSISSLCYIVSDGLGTCRYWVHQYFIFRIAKNYLETSI